MAGFFPSLEPSFCNTLWFEIGNKNEEAVLSSLEQSYANKVKSKVEEGKDIIPIGKSNQPKAGGESNGEDVDQESGEGEESEAYESGSDTVDLETEMAVDDSNDEQS